MHLYNVEKHSTEQTKNLTLISWSLPHKPRMYPLITSPNTFLHCLMESIAVSKSASVFYFFTTEQNAFQKFSLCTYIYTILCVHICMHITTAPYVALTVCWPASHLWIMQILHLIGVKYETFCHPEEQFLWKVLFLKLQADFGNCRNFEELGNTHFFSGNFCFIFLLSCFNSFCILKNVALSCLGSVVPKLLLLSVATVVHCYGVWFAGEKQWLWFYFYLFIF